MKKRILGVLIAVMMLACILPTTVFAEESTNVASVTFDGVTNAYATIDEAWAAAIAYDTAPDKKATVTLLANCAAADTLTNNEDYIVLNVPEGIVLTAKGAVAPNDYPGIKTTGGELEIIGKGEITRIDSRGYSYGTIYITGGKVTVDGPKISCCDSTDSIAVKLGGSGEFHFISGEIFSEHYAISFNYGNAKVYLYSGKIEAEGRATVMNEQQADAPSVIICYSENPLILKCNSTDANKKIFTVYDTVALDDNVKYININSTMGDFREQTSVPYDASRAKSMRIETVKTLQINADASPAEGGSVTGGGKFDAGEAVTMTATANPGYRFVNWTENGSEVSTDATYSFTATTDSNLVANFEILSYDVWVAGVQLTWGNTVIDSSDNADVTSGSATYDPDTKTLTLENFKFEGAATEVGWYSGAVMAPEDITIVLVGENSLINTNDMAYCASGIYGEGSVEIIGNGTASLYVESAIGIEALGVLSINGVDLEAKASGEWGALRGEDLEILDSKVILTTTNVLYGEGMCGVNTITIKNSDVTVTSNYKAVTGGEVSIIDSTVTLNSKQYSINVDGDIEIKNSTFNASIPDNNNYREMSVIMTDGNVLIEKSTANITTGETRYSSYGINADTVTFDNSFVTLDTASGACKTTNGVTVTNASVYDDDSQVDAPDASTYSGNYVKLVPLRTVTVNYGIDGVENKVITISGGDKVTLDSPLFYGYIFMGWFADEDFTTAFDFTTPITVDTTIYAKLVNYESDKTELENALTALQNAVENKADAATVNTALANLQAAIEALEAVKNNYAAADSALKTELEEKITAAQTAAINAATTLVNNAKAELQTAINAKADAATVNTAIADLEAAIDALEAVKDDYAEADATLKADLEAKIAAAKSELKALISNIQSELDAAKAKLDKAIADLNKAITNGDKELSDEIAALDAALADAKAALEKADADNKAELTEKIDTAESTLKAAVDALSSELNATNEKVAKLEKLVVIVCIVAGAAFLASATVAVFYIVNKKKD